MDKKVRDKPTVLGVEQGMGERGGLKLAVIVSGDGLNNKPGR